MYVQNYDFRCMFCCWRTSITFVNIYRFSRTVPLPSKLNISFYYVMKVTIIRPFYFYLKQRQCLLPKQMSNVHSAYTLKKRFLSLYEPIQSVWRLKAYDYFVFLLFRLLASIFLYFTLHCLDWKLLNFVISIKPGVQATNVQVDCTLHIDTPKIG